MSKERCPEPKPECRLYPNKCYSDIHHDYYPSSWYKTSLEKSFRQLDENKERLCRMEHDERHATELPPEKPDKRFMLDAIRRAAQERLRGE